jgi:hypothetical protein
LTPIVSSNDLLTEAVFNRLSAAVQIEATDQQHMASTYGIQSFSEIQRFFLDENSGDALSVMALLYCPDEKFQTDIEPFLESAEYTHTDEKAVCHTVMALQPRSILYFSDMGSITVRIPHVIVQSFITRLNIRRKTDPQILETLNRSLDEPLLSCCKIHLRNSRWIQNESHIRLLLTFIQHTHRFKDDFPDELKILLDFLSVHHPESDMLQALFSEKERLIHLLDKADRQDELLRSAPMETIMLQGIRIISIERAPIIRRIHVLDQLITRTTQPF